MDFTYVRTWAGFVYVAFIVDVFAQMIVAWNAATTKQTDLVMTPLRMALWQRAREGHPIVPGTLIGHADAGSQGGFNWSSQHLEFGGGDGQASWVDVGVDGEGAIPAQVGTQVKSTTHNSLGRHAVKSRPTRSGGRIAPGLGRVVRNTLPRVTPRSPSARIRRATWQRGAGGRSGHSPAACSRCRCRHTLRTPYSPRPICFEPWMRRTWPRTTSSLTARADCGRVLAAS